MLVGTIARALRLASRLVCLIVIVAFAIFAVHQTNGASSQAVTEINGRTAPAKEHPPSTIHRWIDEASNGLTSPFHSVTSGISSQWTIHIIDLLLALLLYGFILGYLTRLISLKI